MLGGTLGGCTFGDGNEGGGGSAGRLLTYPDAEVIPGAYLVVFDDPSVSRAAVSRRAIALAALSSGRITHVFRDTVRGFSVRNASASWARAISRRPAVSFVRQDFRIRGSELRGGAVGPVPWNLDRIDQRAPFVLDRDYRLKTGPTGTAAPVPIYVLDNGVYAAHNEFATASGSRVTNVADVRGTNFARCALTVPDAGHGTRAASIAAGKTLGITPTRVMNVKVLDRGALGNTCGAGSPTDVLAGLEATLQHMVANQVTKAVVNLSLGWSGNTPDVATAVSRLQARGAIVVAAAGNDDQDASGTTPAKLPGVLAVGATTTADARVNLSNFGSAVALWAPGASIKAADWPASPNPSATSFASGTSNAAPHVTGAAALLWQQNPTMSAAQVASELRSRATRSALTDLGAGSVNALLYIGEDAPAKGPTHLITRSGSSGELRAVRVANDWTRVYVAGREPYAYAAYRIPDVSSGPLWQVTHAGSPAKVDCVDIHASNATVGGGIPGEPVYFGCMGTRNNAREAVVLATQQENTPVWSAPGWLGAGSELGGITDDYHVPQARVFAIATRPKPPSGTEVFVTSLDENGQQVASRVLTGTGFSEQFHRAVDVVIVDVPTNPSGTSTDTQLVATTSSDPPGPDKTFLWRLDPATLQIVDFREVPAPPLATNGMSASALAVQPLEANGLGIVVPAEVFLATTVAVAEGGGAVPWSYIYRLKPDWVSANAIEVVKNAVVSSLWSEDGDLYFGGMTTRTFPPGDVFGIPKPGPNPDYDALLGKSEGVYNRRRWTVSFDTPGQPTNSGYVGFGARTGYLVGRDASSFYVVEYPVY